MTLGSCGNSETSLLPEGKKLKNGYNVQKRLDAIILPATLAIIKGIQNLIL